MRSADLAEALTRVRIRVRGQVQGVGFRPFVYRLATELGLAGWVRNDAAGVELEVEGPAEAIAAFTARLSSEAPVLARVAAVETSELAVRGHDGAFVIAPSGGGRAATAVTPDAALCAQCLRELCDPTDRRYRYAFVTCTHCGPRYTITRALPYDRPQTSMARFRQCPDCQREYDDPRDRRFHAQPNACPVCGPRLRFVAADGSRAQDDPIPGRASDDPIAATLERLRRGGIVAIKGLGGFHLACDARDAAAVAELRRRKNREEKPLAVMVANAASLAPFAHVDAAARATLESPERPIVLLPKIAGADAALPGVAPGLAWIGAMLPCTPVQWLLFHEAAGRPAGTAWTGHAQELVLVMTSANPGGEPIVRDDDEALARLAGIADAWLLHDREIVTRCDDSVVRASCRSGADANRHAVQFIRRARGYTPQAIRLPAAGPSVLALGAFLKNTICLTRGDEAFLSQHVGDLDNAPTCATLEETAQRMMELLEIEPALVAHDLHPDFFSTRRAAEWARGRGAALVAVQHHHAHVAAIAAEHGVDGPLLGLALDGVGLGTDGGTWGGELLRVDGERCERLGHLAEIALPGGDRAAREPWRMGVAALHRLGRAAEAAERFPGRDARALVEMLDRGVRCPPTSSMGRWFDAAAALAGVREVAAFEGQAAMLFEGLAAAHGAVEALSGGFSLDGSDLDFAPLLGAIADLCGPRVAAPSGIAPSDIAPFGIDPSGVTLPSTAARAAALFHATVADGIAAWAVAAARAHGLRRVALGGGCFMNHVLATGLRARLEREGLEVLEAVQAPPNDGGIALGQAWVAIRTALSA